MFGRRRPRRVARRTLRRAMHRRMRRRRIIIGGAVLLVGAGAAAVKLSQQDAQRVEQHTGKPPEELSEDELAQAMRSLGITSIALDANDQAVITREEETDNED